MNTVPSLGDREFQLFRNLIHEVCGINLSVSKRHMLQARLTKRLRALNLSDFDDYYKLLTSDSVSEAEQREFINCVTTNKTDFFREPHHFEFFTETLLPQIYKKTSSELNVWHAGCSTGEEPYTLSIALHEALQGKHLTVRQLATDIDTRALEVAQQGLYEIEKLNPIPERLTKKYFYKGKGEKEGLALAKPELSEWLTFGRLNLLDEQWPFKPETRFDAIFCRNVMIYFDKPTQRRLVSHFESVLAPGGYLFIGHSESLFGIGDGLECLGKTIYRQRDSLRVAA